MFEKLIKLGFEWKGARINKIMFSVGGGGLIFSEGIIYFSNTSHIISYKSNNIYRHVAIKITNRHGRFCLFVCLFVVRKNSNLETILTNISPKTNILIQTDKSPVPCKINQLCTVVEVNTSELLNKKRNLPHTVL